MAGLMSRLLRRKTPTQGNGGALAAPSTFPSILQRLQTEFDEIFDRFGRQFPSNLCDFSSGGGFGLDVEDKEDSFVLQAEVPGFQAKDFDVRVCGDRLTLRANRKAEGKEKEGEYSEECSCYESVTLPSGIDKDKIAARCQNGVLTVTIPKTKEGQGKKIAVTNA